MLQRQASAENERLTRKLNQLRLENSIIRKTLAIRNRAAKSHHFLCREKHDIATELFSYNPDDRHHIKIPSHCTTVPSDDDSGQILLDSNAIWDLINSHVFCKRGLADLYGVIQNLERHLDRGGQCAGFFLPSVIAAIGESMSHAVNDDLL